MGESLATVEKHSTPIAEAKTPSLEALKAYSTGMKVVVSSGNAAAIPFFRRAVEIDPNLPRHTRFWGSRTAVLGTRCRQLRTPQKRGNCGTESATGRSFYRLHLRPAGDGKSGKGVPNSRVVASDLSSREESESATLLGGLSTQGTGRFERGMEAAQNEIRANSTG